MIDLWNFRFTFSIGSPSTVICSRWHVPSPFFSAKSKCLTSVGSISITAAPTASTATGSVPAMIRFISIGFSLVSCPSPAIIPSMTDMLGFRIEAKSAMFSLRACAHVH